MRLVTAIPSCRLTPEYIAGFFDGEGSIYIGWATGAQARAFKNKEATFDFVVSISNTYRPILDALVAEYGGRLTTHNGGSKKTVNTRDGWTWRLHGLSAARLLTEIEPFLVEKRGYAIAALFFMDTLRWPRDWRVLSEEQKTIRQNVLRFMKQNPNPSGHSIRGRARIACA